MTQPPLPKTIGRYNIISMLGRGGIKRVIEYDLDDAEREALRTSAAGVAESTEAVKGMIQEKT